MFLDFLIPIAYAAQDNGAADSAKSGLTGKVAEMLDFIIGQIPSWIAAVIVFGATLFIAKIARNAVEGKISDQVDEEHQEVLVLAGRLTTVGVLTIGSTIALKIAGIDLTTILAAIAFGVGFALRDFLANFFAGIYILTSKQFSIGDFIQIGGTIGRVMEIQSRATILKTYDGYKVVVPNSDIFTKQVKSLTTNPVRRIQIPLYISYDTDIDYAMKIAKRIINKNPKILKKPAPSVIVKNYGDSSIDLMARFWVESKGGWFKIKSDLTKMLWEGFMEAGIDVPYNIMHLETSQDTAANLKAGEERMKAVKEKWKAAKQAKLGTVPETLPPQQAEALKQVAAEPTPAPVVAEPIPAPVAPPAQIIPQQNLAPAAASIPAVPPGVYQDLEELDANG